MLSKSQSIVGVCIATVIVTILTVTGGGYALSAWGSFGKSEPPVAPAPFPRLADSLQVELNTALNPESSFSFEAVGNPFADQTGVSNAKNTSAPAPLTAGIDNLPSATPKPTPVVAVNTGQNYAPYYPVAGGVPPMPPPPVPTPTPVIDTKELVSERNRQIKLGQKVPSLASIYSIDEVVPYGIVGIGANNRVKLFSAATGARFSVARGTRFRDGTIESLDNEGVSFRRDSGQTVFLRWAKVTSKDGSKSNDAPILRQIAPSSSGVPQISDAIRP